MGLVKSCTPRNYPVLLAPALILMIINQCHFLSETAGDGQVSDSGHEPGHDEELYVSKSIEMNERLLLNSLMIDLGVRILIDLLTPTLFPNNDLALNKVDQNFFEAMKNKSNLLNPANNHNFNDNKNNDIYLSENCMNSLDRFSAGLRLSQPWAMHLAHSSGKFPSSQLHEGNYYALGSFDRCLVPVGQPVSSTLGLTRLTTQYCVLSFDISTLVFTPAQGYSDTVLQALKTQTPICSALPTLYYRMGACLPADCDPFEWAYMANQSLNRVLSESFNTNIAVKRLLGWEDLTRQMVLLQGVGNLVKLEKLTCTGQVYSGAVINLPNVTRDLSNPSKIRARKDFINLQLSTDIRSKRIDLMIGMSFFVIFTVVTIIAGFRESGKCLVGKRYARGPIYVSIANFVSCFSPAKNFRKITTGVVIAPSNNTGGCQECLASAPNSSLTQRVLAGVNGTIKTKHAETNGTLKRQQEKLFQSNETLTETTSQSRKSIKEPIYLNGTHGSNGVHNNLTNGTDTELQTPSIVHVNPYSPNPNLIGKEYLKIIYGIRGLSMLHVVYAHTYLFSSFVSSNIGEILGPRLLEDPWILFLYSGFFAVDTFFFLSGFVYVISTLKKTTNDDEYIKSSNDQNSSSNRGFMNSILDTLFLVLGFTVKLFKIFVRRIARLLPVYSAVIVFEALIVPHIGTFTFGPPPFNLITYDNSKFCRQNWWTNLTFLNNFLNTRSMCGVWTWYLANDMQFHLVAPFIMEGLAWLNLHWATSQRIIPFSVSSTAGYLTKSPSKRNKKDFYILYFCTILGLIVTYSFYDSFVHRYKPGIFPDDPLILDYFYNYYIKPISRIAPFIVGLALGYHVSRGENSISQSVVNEKPGIVFTYESPSLQESSKPIPPALSEKGWKWISSLFMVTFSLTSIPLLYAFWPVMARVWSRFLWEDPTRLPAISAGIVNSTARILWSLALSVLLLHAKRLLDRNKPKIQSQKPDRLEDDNNNNAYGGSSKSGDLLILTIIERVPKFVYGFLSLPIWITLGNLTYATYLIHPSLIQIVYKNLRQPIYMCHLYYLILFLGFLTLSLACALYLNLCFEQPLLNLTKLLINSFPVKAQSTNQKDENNFHQSKLLTYNNNRSLVDDKYHCD